MRRLIGPFVLCCIALLTQANFLQYWDGSYGRAEEQTCVTESGANFCRSCGVGVVCLPQGTGYREFEVNCVSPQACFDGVCVDLPPDPMFDPQLENCTCDGTTDHYAPDQYSPDYYIYCQGGNNEHYLKCDDGLQYNDVAQRCTPPVTTTTPEPLPPCTESGTFAIDCYNYEICSFPGADPIVAQCNATGDPPQFFDPNTRKCEDQVAFTCEDATGIVAGHRDTFDCQHYYICVGTSLIAEGCCADGFYFNNDPLINDCEPNDGSQCIDNSECTPTISPIPFSEIIA